MDDLIKIARTLANKRRAILKEAEPCPKCGTEQVQLVEWVEEVEWKCRHCGHKWNV